MTPLRLPIIVSLALHAVSAVVLILVPFVAKAVFEPRQEMTVYLMEPVSSAPAVQQAESPDKPESSLARMDQPVRQGLHPAHHVVRATNPKAGRAIMRAAVTSVSKTAEPSAPLVPRFIEMPRSFDTAGPRLLTDREGMNLPADMISTVGALPNIAIVPPPSRPVLTGGANPRPVLRDASAERMEAGRSKARSGQNARPEYPRAARQAGWEGTVMLRVEILADGKAGMVSVDQTSGHVILDDAALSAVQRWRFSPAMDGNFPIKSVVHLPVRFDLRAQ
jgi:TonB family protein